MSEIKQISFKFTGGINQDNDPQSTSPDTAYKLFNIKMQNLDGSTVNALVNEKGNEQIPIIYKEFTRDQDTDQEPEIPIEEIQDAGIEGDIIGVIQCGINTVVVFTYYKKDGIDTNEIIKLEYDPTQLYIKATKMFIGDLNVQDNNNISGIFIYENSELQKIYWVDGINQLRYLNISDSNPLIKDSYITDPNLLNSNPSFKINHKIEVERIEGGGKFQAGVIQWAFTYYNKYGAETGIVDMTPLYYIAHEHRGGKADEIIGCSYKIRIINPDTDFDYLRLYSIQRTALNGTPVVKIVNNYKLKNS